MEFLTNMFLLLPHKTQISCISAILAICLFLVLALQWFFTSSSLIPADLSGWYRPMLVTITLTAATAPILGAPSVVNRLWNHLPFLNRIIGPNINGSYEIKTTSNWPTKKHMLDCVEGELVNRKSVVTEESGLEKIGALAIKQGLFKTQIVYNAIEIGPSTTRISHVTAVELFSDKLSGEWILDYVFKSETVDPKTTDSDSYLGAARLKFSYVNESVMEMHGHYWTNRSWNRGLNTAGQIKLVRV